MDALLDLESVVNYAIHEFAELACVDVLHDSRLLFYYRIFGRLG